MKKLILPVIAFFLAMHVMAQKPISRASALDETLEQKMKERTIPGAEIGTLICEDEYGKWKICSGSEYEEVKGFATTVPYVTANKVPPGENKTEFIGIASTSAGEINEWDYLCPCEQNPGMVKKCDKTDFPYAKAMGKATSTGQKIKVKVLGYRR